MSLKRFSFLHNVRNALENYRVMAKPKHRNIKSTQFKAQIRENSLSLEHKKTENRKNEMRLRIVDEYYQVLQMENIYKKVLVNQLMKECGIDIYSLPMMGFEKCYILQTKIETLKKFNIVKSSEAVTESLLSQLEPFPFDQSLIENSVNIMEIKNSIEKQYLAWKFNDDLKRIDVIFARFKVCLFKYSSLKSMAGTLERIQSENSLSNQSIVNQIFLLQVRPCPFYTFKDNLLGMSWDMAVLRYPALLRKSYHYAIFVTKFLLNEGFSRKQIHNGLAYLRVGIHKFTQKLDFILSDDVFGTRRGDQNFLQLLLLSNRNLRSFYEERRSFDEIMKLLEVYENSLSRRMAFRNVSYQIMKNLIASETVVETLRKHWKYSSMSDDQIEDTLAFLAEKNFTEQEILESITVILYPRKLLEKALENLTEQDAALREMGFLDGCVPEETHIFTHGTKLRRKTLQLCLYFIEIENGFSGTFNYHLKMS